MENSFKDFKTCDLVEELSRRAVSSSQTPTPPLADAH